MRRLACALLAVAACQQQESKPQGEAPAPRGDCARTAEALATFELGIAARPEQRRPVVGKHLTACESANITPEETDCILRATDTWSAINCAPRMFPQKRPAIAATCKPVVARIRAAVVTQIPKDAGSGGMIMVDKMMPILERSCDQDGWPVEVRECIMTAPVGDMKAVQKCQDAMPQQIQDKISKRMASEMPQ